MRLGGDPVAVVREVVVPNREGLHARPVMSFVDLASRFSSTVSVANKTRGRGKVDGKSAMQMMLLEATEGCVLEIEVCGDDAHAAVESLVALVEAGFNPDTPQRPASP